MQYSNDWTGDKSVTSEVNGDDDDDEPGKPVSHTQLVSQMSEWMVMTMMTSQVNQSVTLS